MLAFFTETIGFVLSDTVVDAEGGLRTFFVRCSPEHHSLAFFAASENRLDHHCYEAGEWNLIRDWADHFAKLQIKLKWGPGRHGPGDNLFLFIHDVDGNWVEISAELEHVAPDKPAGSWPHEERTLNSWGIGLLRS
jgi:catechol 2,3-dioxygenase